MIALVAPGRHVEGMLNVRSIELRPPHATLTAVDEGVEAVYPVGVGRTAVVDVLIGATVPKVTAAALLTTGRCARSMQPLQAAR
jgi:hypothetical protein